MIKLVDVVELKPLDGLNLWVRFSDGTEGVRDFSEFVSRGGPMVEPLKDTEYFKKAFISFGVPTWPNGFDVDAINLQLELRAAGKLSGAAA